MLVKNKINNHEQIILKMKMCLCINAITNKSFKFQSEWPYNNLKVICYKLY